MKKLYRKRKVYPSPPPPPPTIADHLSLIPATILSLAAALSLEDKEVLAYLISCCSSSSSSSSSSTTSNFRGDRKTSRSRKIGVNFHEPTFGCNCFRCYMSFWARWDASPNRELIHEIIEAYEEGLFQEKKQEVKNSKKGRRKRDRFHDSHQGNGHGSSGLGSVKLNDSLKSVEINGLVEEEEEDEKEVEFESEKSSIRKIVSFIGDSIWGVWGRN